MKKRVLLGIQLVAQLVNKLLSMMVVRVGPLNDRFSNAEAA
jgi:hypothetical protein